MPELDDEFAKDVSEFDTLEEYKADLRKNLAESRKTEAERSFKSEIMNQALDNMTAEVPELDWALLKRITARITAEVPGVNRVLYDLTPKPCATIEWE